MRDDVTAPIGNKIRVGYVIDTLARGGGTENQLALLIEHLDKRRFVPVVFNLRPPTGKEATDLPCTYVFLDVESVVSLKGIRAFFRLAATLRSTKIDIVQVYFWDSRVFGTLAAALAGVRAIIFCRREMGWRFGPLHIRAVRLLNRLAHYCLVNAQAIRTQVVSTEHFPADRIVVVPNGVNPPDPFLLSKSRSNTYNIPERCPVVGIIANLRPMKRIDRFIHMAEHIEDKSAHFLIVGTGEIDRDLRKEIESSSVKDRLHFVQSVKRAAEVLGIFTIGVLTSESEGMPNVLIEYALAGIPSVAFDTGGVKEVIDDGVTGYVIPMGDEDLMADRINHLLQDADLRHSMGWTACLRATASFGVDQMVRATEQFYDDVMRERPRTEKPS